MPTKSATRHFLNCGVIAMLCSLTMPTFAQTQSVLYTFQTGTDAAIPYAGLVRDSVGNLYGTTLWGGVYNDGTVFKLDRHNHESAIHAGSRHPHPDTPHYPLADAHQLAEKDMAFVQRGDKG